MEYTAKKEEEIEEALKGASFYVLIDLLGNLRTEAQIESRYKKGMGEVKDCIENIDLTKGLWMKQALLAYHNRLKNGQWDRDSANLRRVLSFNIWRIIEICSEHGVWLRKANLYDLYA